MIAISGWKKVSLTLKHKSYSYFLNMIWKGVCYLLQSLSERLKKSKMLPFLWLLRNEIKVIKVGKIYMMYWLQFSHLISGCSSQHVRFVSFTGGFNCKGVLRRLFLRLLTGFSPSTPTPNNIQLFSLCRCRVLILKLSYPKILVEKKILTREIQRAYEICDLYHVRYPV